MSKIPKILLIKEDEVIHNIDKLEQELGKTEHYPSVENVFREKNQRDYNVLIIHASINYELNKDGKRVIGEEKGGFYTKIARERNPNILTIGVSIQGEHFKSDPDCKKLYDERYVPFGIFPSISDIISLRTLLKDRGFTLPKSKIDPNL